MILVIGLGTFLRAWLLGSAVLALGNLALRHLLLVRQRSMGRARLSRWDRIPWVWLGSRRRDVDFGPARSTTHDEE
jgi:hypothetical protein